MITSDKTNVLILQSGGCTPVLNRSLFGIVDEALGHNEFGRIYGAAYGLEGLLTLDLIDLGKQTNIVWARIARTPGAALGSTRRKLRSDDMPSIFNRFEKENIGYLFIIGGNDSAETGHTIFAESKKTGYDLAVINVPKTIDNDLTLTDHSPGYGSAARFVALAVMGAGRDAESMGQFSPITLIEVMGRDAGWLAAASAIGRRDERDAPHLIAIPETPLHESRFLTHIEDAYRRFGFAVAVIAENTRGLDGVLGGQSEPWYVDDFGHPYFDGPGRYLAQLIGRRLNVRVRHEVPGTIQRSMATCVSRTDVREAEMVGRAAVRYALGGHTDRIVTLIRLPGEEYNCDTGLAPLEAVAGLISRMPHDYLDTSNYFVTPQFIQYLRPLVGSLPRFGRLI